MPWARPAGSSRASDPVASAAAKAHGPLPDKSLNVVSLQVDVSPHSIPFGKENGAEPKAKRRKVASGPLASHQRPADSAVRQPAPPQHTSPARCRSEQHDRTLTLSSAQPGGGRGPGQPLTVSRRPVTTPAEQRWASQPAQDEAPAAARQVHIAGDVLPHHAICAVHGTHWCSLHTRCACKQDMTHCAHMRLAFCMQGGSCVQGGHSRQRVERLGAVRRSRRSSAPHRGKR